MAIQVRNPHSVLAALTHRPDDVLEIRLPGEPDPRSDEGWAKVVQLARANKVTVRFGGSAGGRDRDREAGRVGGSEAQMRERLPLSIEELFASAKERNEGKGLWIALDCLQDPHNVGAIFRAASFFGVQGILITQERSAPLTGTVYDVACGGVESVPFSQVINLRHALDVAKEEGLWILGTSEHAESDFSSIERDRPWLVVFGNEEKGLRRLTEESCDLLCKIAPKGEVTSLNVSVAAGIFISKLS